MSARSIAKRIHRRLFIGMLLAVVVFVGDAHGARRIRRILISVTAINPNQISLSGTAVQGPMVGSTVTAYAVASATGTNWSVLGTTTTDGFGNFTLTIQPPSGAVRLVATGGSFVSEADGSTVYPAGGLAVLLPGAIADSSGISINPLTTFVDALTVGKLQTGGTTFSAALSGATARIESYYGLSTDPALLLPDYTASAVGTDTGNLALILGALIDEDQSLCPTAPGGLVTALSADIADGVFDATRAGVPVPYCGGELPAIAGTSDFQDALAGVQQLQYVSAGFAFGGLYGPAGNILLNQNPPVTPDLLVASLATIDAAVTQAAPPTSSTSSPPMTVARASATATLLPNGKVLIAGGFDSSTTTVSPTELYDPATDTFSAGPSMSHARGEATATLLSNGKVLIAGGNDGSNALSSTEFYDVATKSFAPGPSMIAARFGAGATLLPNGKVLIAGGNGSSGGLSSTEIYDPSADSFAAGPVMSLEMGPSTAILMPNGKVLIVGEGSYTNPNISVAQLYDSANNSMVERSLGTFRQFPAATLLPNGKVLVAGGVDLSVTLTSTQIYDPSQDAFTAGPSMDTGHWFATAAPTANGKVLIIGGNDSSTIGIENVDVYDPVSNSFTAGAPMSDKRVLSTATLLPNGRVLIAGGWNGTNSIQSTELYAP